MSTEKAHALEARLNAHLSGSSADTGIADVTTTGLKTLTATPDAIPAGALAGGEHFECDAAGQFTTGNPAPTGIDFYIFYGTTSGTQLNDLGVPAAGLWINAAAAAWRYRADIIWVSASRCRVSAKLGWRTAAGVTNSVTYHNYSDVSSIDSTAANKLTFGFQFTGTGLTLTTGFAHFTRRR